MVCVFPVRNQKAQRVVDQFPEVPEAAKKGNDWKKEPQWGDMQSKLLAVGIHCIDI